MTDNALKAIRQTDDTLTVANYIILYGGRDLEGEYFTADTALESPYTKAGRLPVDWEHGLEKAGPAGDVLGYVDWSTAKADDRGVWVERTLDRHHQYVKWIEALIDEGVIGSSSAAMPKSVQKAEDGRIAVWPLQGDALTVTPMEPRMISENVIQAYKALGLQIPTETVETETEPEADTSAASVVGTVDVVADSTKTITTEVIMSEEQTSTATVVAPVVDYDLIAKEAIKAYQAALKAEPTNSGIVVVEDEADKAIKARPYKSLGEFLGDVIRAGSGDFDSRLIPLRSRDRIDEGAFSLNGALGDDFVGSVTKSAYLSRNKAVATGLGIGQDSTGGFLTTTDRQGGILARVYETGELLSRVSMDGLSGTNNGLTINAENETSRADGSRRGGVRAYWAAEAGSYTASNPTFRQVELKLKKVVGLVYATDEQIADTNALESYIMRVLPEELRFVVEDSIINGSGAGQPKGVLATGATISIAKETGQAAASVVSQNIIKMWARMWSRSRRNAIWLVNQSVEPQLMQLSLAVGSGGVLVYTPPGGLSVAPYGTIFGRPVISHESCAALGTVGDILLVDPTEYQMIEKGGIQSASSIHVAFTTGEQLFRFTYRCDGQPLWNSALTPLSAGDTLSPYLSLATRS